jgi:GNAT superfamily N-acetyltransferase
MAQLEKILIRKAVLDDLSMMLQIMDESLETPTVDDEMKERMERWLTKLDNNSQFIFYVAEIDRGNLIGWCRGGQTVEPHKIVAHQTYDCEIHTIFIRPQYQRRGIGYELWKITWNDVLLSFHPKDFVVWSVDKTGRQQFYLSLGGVEKESRKFNEECVLTAFVWHELKLYEATSFLMYK